MVTSFPRLSGALAFASLAFVTIACYSGLSNLEPFPCADDGTCPNGILCENGECVCPETCGGSCTDTTSDPNNCGACGITCALTTLPGTQTSACANSTCTNSCTLFGSSAQCPSGSSCGISVQNDEWQTACYVTGTVGLGQPCSHGTDCAAGSQCLEQSGVSWCYQLCDDNNPCPSSGVCNTNGNIPNGGGYCDTPSGCGATFTVQCTGSDGSYTCPVNSQCNSTADNPKECDCDTGYTAYNCQEETSEEASCAAGTPWWCD